MSQRCSHVKKNGRQCGNTTVNKLCLTHERLLQMGRGTSDRPNKFTRDLNKIVKNISDPGEKSRVLDDLSLYLSKNNRGLNRKYNAGSRPILRKQMKMKGKVAEDAYTVIDGNNLEVRDKGTANTKVTVEFNPKYFQQIDSKADIENMLNKMLDNIVNKIKAKTGLTGNDKISIQLSDNTSYSNGFMKLSSFSADELLKRNANMLQSWENQNFATPLGVSITTIKLPRGGGSTNNKYILNAQDVFKKRSIVSIKNEDDNMCAARAIIVGKAHNNKVSDLYHYQKLTRSGQPKFLTGKSKEIYDMLGKEYDECCDLEDIIKIEDILKL